MEEEDNSWDRVERTRDIPVSAEETLVFDSRNASTFFPKEDGSDSVDFDKTPTYSPEVVRQLERRDNRTELALALTKYLAKLPEVMSLPAPRILATYSQSEILEYEQMYRHLDGELKGILEEYGPRGTKFLTFHELLQASSSMASTDKLQEQYRWYVHFLPKHLYLQVVSSLELYAAFAEVIGNAKLIQKRGY